MFSEYNDQVDQLKASDHEFLRMFERHHALDQKIKNMEMRIELGTHEQMEVLKKEKLRIKDHLYVILRKAIAARA